MSEETNKWFDPDRRKKKPAKTTGKEAPRFVYLKNGQSTELTFLDPNPTEDNQNLPETVDVIEVFGFEDPNHKYPTFILDPESIGEHSPIAEYRESIKDSDPTKYDQLKTTTYYVQTVLQHDYDEGGEPYPASRRARLAKEYLQKKKTTAKSLELAAVKKGPLKDIEGLYGNTFAVGRSTEQTSPKIGEIGEYLGTPALDELHENPTPFTQEEILALFVTDVKKMQEYVDRMESSYSPPKPN